MSYSVLKKIGNIYRSLEYISNVEFKKYGLDNHQYVYVVRVGENPGIINNNLSQMIKVDKTTVSRNITRLIKLGLIKKETTLNNQKEKKLFLTENGKQIYQRIIAEHDYSEKKLLKGIDQSDINHLNQILNQIVDNSNQEWEDVKDGKSRKY